MARIVVLSLSAKKGNEDSGKKCNDKEGDELLNRSFRFN